MDCLTTHQLSHRLISFRVTDSPMRCFAATAIVLGADVVGLRWNDACIRAGYQQLTDVFVMGEAVFVAVRSSCLIGGRV